MAWRGTLPHNLLPSYVAVQLIGAMLGAWLAHAMFDMNILQFSTRARTGGGIWLAEGVATFGLLLVILRAPASRASAMVACYIGAAYWFTSSTSFANPAAAFGRMFSDSFTGIAPGDVGAFVLAELVGAGAAAAVDRWLGAPAARRGVDRRGGAVRCGSVFLRGRRAAPSPQPWTNASTPTPSSTSPASG